MALSLVYWGARRLTKLIRNLLILKYVNFENKRYMFGPSRNYDREDWLNQTALMGLNPKPCVLH